jgi:hypothetical protein
LEEVDKRRSVPNCIFYLHANSCIFNPLLAILINFLKSKTAFDFPKFLFKIISESEVVSMEKVVHLFEIFKTIFYLKILELMKDIFGPVQILKQFELGLNPFEFEIESHLNRCRRYCGRGPHLSPPGPLFQGRYYGCGRVAVGRAT